MSDWEKAREAAMRAVTKAWIDDASARTTLDAALSAFSAAGYEVVPKRLSHNMARAWEFGPNGNPEDSLEDYWQPSYEAMITAALKERT